VIILPFFPILIPFFFSYLKIGIFFALYKK